MDPVAIVAVLGLAFVGKSLNSKSNYVSDNQAALPPTVVTIRKPREDLFENPVYSIAGGLNVNEHVSPPSTKKNSSLPSFQVPNFKPVFKTPVNYNADRVFDSLTSISRNVNPENKDGKTLLTTAPGLGLGSNVSGYSSKSGVRTAYGGGGQGFHYGAVQPLPILTNADVLVNGTMETGTLAGNRGAAIVKHTPLAPAISGYSGVDGITEPPSVVLASRDLEMPPMIPNNPGGPKSYSAPPDSLYNVFPTNRDQILAPNTGGLTMNAQQYRPGPNTYQPMSDIRSTPNDIFFRGSKPIGPTTEGKVTTMRTDSQYLNYVIPNMTSAQSTASIGTVTLNSVKGQVNTRNTFEALGSYSSPLKTNQFAIPSFTT
jgi:hypothetical protein